MDFQNLDEYYAYLENDTNFQYLDLNTYKYITTLRDKTEDENTKKLCSYELFFADFSIEKGAHIPKFQSGSNAYPTLELFDDNFDYIKTRANNVKNQKYKAKYNHLLWLSPQKHIDFAKQAIENYLLLLQNSSFSVYDNNLDFIAPGTNSQYICLDSETETNYVDVFTSPILFGASINGTSFAAPHVSGVVALMHGHHNVANGYPNNLAIEDFEFILQKYATAVPYDIPSSSTGLSVPNTYNGYGRINVNEALDKVDLPVYYVLHGGGTNSPLQSIVPNTTFILANNYGTFAAGYYFADRYQVTNTFLHVLPNIDQTAIDIWPRLNSSIGFSQASPNDADNYFQMSTTISGNVVAVTTTTFCYFITSTLGGSTVNQWIPGPPASLRTYYSVHVKDNTPNIGIEEEAENNIGLFPNPSTNIINLSFDLVVNADMKIEILDISGRIVANYNNISSITGTNNIQLDISNLSCGTYLCKLTIDGDLRTRKFVKQ